MNDGYKAYCGGMTPPLPDMLFHDVVEASHTPGYKAAAPLRQAGRGARAKRVL